MEIKQFVYINPFSHRILMYLLRQNIPMASLIPRLCIDLSHTAVPPPARNPRLGNWASSFFSYLPTCLPGRLPRWNAPALPACLPAGALLYLLLFLPPLCTCVHSYTYSTPRDSFLPPPPGWMDFCGLLAVHDSCSFSYSLCKFILSLSLSLSAFYTCWSFVSRSYHGWFNGIADYGAAPVDGWVYEFLFAARERTRWWGCAGSWRWKNLFSKIYHVELVH